MRTLTKIESRWARGAFGAIFPANELTGIGICDLDVETFLMEVRSATTFKSALGVRAAIWIVAFAPLFVLGKLRTISGLDQASREVVVGALMASPIYFVRQLTMLLKAIGAILYAGAPAVRKIMVPVRATAFRESGTRPLVTLGLGKGSHERKTA
ncbi:MAG: hypothetical protein ABIP39_10625 [Polyangiaceae bacterium]